MDVDVPKAQRSVGLGFYVINVTPTYSAMMIVWVIVTRPGWQLTTIHDLAMRMLQLLTGQWNNVIKYVYHMVR
jgi:hypothetical protein